MLDRLYDYDIETLEFIEMQSILYLDEVYEETELCTIIEDGKPKKWRWDN